MRGLPRRLAPSLLLGLAVALTLQVATVPTAALREEAPLRVPVLLPGDAGTYDVQVLHPDGTPAGDLSGFWDTYTFRVLPDATDRDGAGNERAVHAHEARVTYLPGGRYTGSHTNTTVDVATGEPVTQTFLWSSAGRAPLSLQDLSTAQRIDGRFTTFRPDAVLCGLRSTLQGDSVRADTPVALHGGCGPEGPLRDHGRHAFHLDGVDEVAGVRAWRFVGDDEPRAAAWFAPDVPVPVRLRLPAVAEGVLRPDYDMLLTLTAFERGPGAGALPALPSTADASAVVPLETGPWHPLHGPDASRAGHPFPVARAVEGLRSDPRGLPLVLFLNDHPDTYLLFANGRTLESDGLTQYRWDLGFTDGRDSIVYRVTHVPGLGGATTYEELDWSIEPTRTPTLAELPVRIPPVDAVTDRWNAVTGGSSATGEAGAAEGPAPTYGFAVVCRRPGCPGLEVLVHAGTNAVVDERVHHDVLAVDADGEPLYRSREDPHGVPLLADLGVASGPPEPRDAPIASTNWFTSSPGLTAASIATGLLATLLWWVVPLLKSAGWSPLFTRVRTDALLEHPVRNEIAQVVRAEPGIHFQELARRVGRGRGVVGHHLDKLERGGLVRGVNQRGYLCFFPPGTGTAALRSAGAVKAPAARRILEAVQEAPGTTVKELSEALGLAASTVHGHVHRMMDAGLLDQWQDGRSKRLRATPADGRAAA